MGSNVVRTDNEATSLNSISVGEVELELLLEGIYRLYGYDFRQYARSTVRRRLAEIIGREALDNLSMLQGKILRTPELLDKVVSSLSIQVSSLFRDPRFYHAFRHRAVPLLRTYPSIRIWLAGCSTGEEVYSMAILLTEEDLLNKCRIYGTDLNSDALATASRGTYSAPHIAKSERDYKEAGGARSLSDYFQISGKEAQILPSLQRRATFFQHNLVTDASFNDFHVIFSRNVLIYFIKPLQDRVHELLYQSLVRFGILGLGANETLHLTPKEKHYRPLDETARLYRRTD
ncbi:MAG TPA: protein-glutamate O-methyltransferase CheR [Terriglobia bacterium]|nr:protein-glutamate O-methyltransferase CheR [Terriglobia bacterium]